MSRTRNSGHPYTIKPLRRLIRNSADGDLAQLSPDYSDQEIGHIWDGNKFAIPYLLPEVVALDLTTTNKLAVPLILFEGRHDRNVNSEVAAAWFDTVKASDKHLV